MPLVSQCSQGKNETDMSLANAHHADALPDIFLELGAGLVRFQIWPCASIPCLTA